jgi:hypothetical protein
LRLLKPVLAAFAGLTSRHPTGKVDANEKSLRLSVLQRSNPRAELARGQGPGSSNSFVPSKACRFRPFLCFSFEYFRYGERAGCLSYLGEVPKPQERTMNITLSRRNALLLTAAATTLPLVNVISNAEEVPLAIKGYDPVAYFTDGKPVQGTAQFEFEWDDHRWRFASAEHRDLFKASPVRYAPQFGNYCAMALALNQIVVADPENWLISDGKLYVFGKPAPAGPELFKKDLAANVSKANGNRSILPKQ